MKAIEITSNGITPLKTSDTAEFALRMMEEFKVTHLPIVNNEDFLGVISESDILSEQDLSQAIGSIKLSLNRASVFENQHVYDVLKLIADSRLSIIPVLNNKNHYMGAITLYNLVQCISNLTAISNPGAVIVLEMYTHDYVLSQIASIIESNDAKILSLYIKPHTDSTKMDVILKISKNDITSIIGTFNRYNYIIKESFSESEYFDMLNDRYDEFLSWLNI
jgi:acetoin utilization protein AcuB